MDFVPVHFAVDSYGLALFDGTPLYEYPHPDVGESEWGSCNFIHSRREVRCFLQSAANYWLEEFHFDGLRMDAVSRLIYWHGEPARGVNAVSYTHLRNLILCQHPLQKNACTSISHARTGGLLYLWQSIQRFIFCYSFQVGFRIAVEDQIRIGCRIVVNQPVQF